MTTAVLTQPPATRTRQRRTTVPEWLVVAGAVVAPLNLLIVRSLTVYDVLIGLALLFLLHRRQLKMPPKPYLALSYVFIIAALLSAFRATHAIEALTQVLQYVFVFFVQIPVVLTVVRTRKLVLRSLFLLCLGTLAAILHAFLTQQTQGAGRVVVFYSENPNRLGYPAVYLLPFVILLWHSTRRSSRRWVRVLATLAALVSIYLTVWALFASASRSSLLGSFVALVVFFVLRPGHGIFRMVGRALVLVMVTVAVGYGLIATGQMPTTLEERITRSFNADAEDQAGLVGDREHLMNAGIHAFVDYPYLGTGLDNFRYVTENYDLDAHPQLPHNLWLQLLVQVGFFGTLAMALILLLWAKDLTHAFRRAHPADAEILWGLVASLAGILTIFMFAPEMLDRHYWLIVAFGLVVADGSRRHRAEGGAA